MTGKFRVKTTDSSKIHPRRITGTSSKSNVNPVTCKWSIKTLNHFFLFCPTCRRDRTCVDNILSTLTTCCMSMEDYHQIESAVKNQLIPQCYKIIGLKPHPLLKHQIDPHNLDSSAVEIGNHPVKGIV